MAFAEAGEWRLNRAFFLDRDGTINVDSGYVGNPDALELLPGAAAAVRKMNDAGYLVIVITNQSGVARGYFGMEDVEKVHIRLNEMLQAHGAHIDAFYCCPHLPNGSVKEFSLACDCRKPQLGLFKRAIQDFDLDPTECFACGDKLRDVENLDQLGVPARHLGVVDGEHTLGHFSSLAEFFDRAINSSC